MIARIAALVVALLCATVLLGPAAHAGRPAPDMSSDYVVHARTVGDAQAAARALGVEPTVQFERAFSGFAAPRSPPPVGGLPGRPGGG
ncbi:MAG: hypothetical protein L0K86_22255, partial [Actinomycetia bacterium]|nr:hypothetical protein [Actinomycetes bacterium]